MASISYFILAFFILGAESKKKLSDLIPLCSLSDPKLSECARSSTQKLLPILAPGVRDLHLIPLDPLNVPSLDIGQDTGPVSLTLKFSNASILGTSRAIVKSMKLDKEGYNFEGDFLFPKFSLVGNYIIKGRILLLPIDGEGFGNITTTNMNVHVKFNCKTIMKKNVEHLLIDQLKLSFKHAKAFISFSNLFRGNKELGETTNRFLNEHAEEIVEEMRGTLEYAFAELNKQLMNSVFQNIPLRDAFTK